MLKTVSRILLLVGLPILFAACGFHLQAPSVLPDEMARTRLEIQNPHSTFARRLSNLLEQNGIEITERGSTAAVLEVSVNKVRKEILTIGDNARVREYRIRHTVSFRLLGETGAVLIPEHSLEQSRVISFDEKDILGAAQEEEFLRHNMAETLSRLVIRYLGQQSRESPGTGKP